MSGVDFNIIYYFAIAIVVICGVLIPVFNVISHVFTFGKPDQINGSEVVLNTKNSLALRRAVVENDSLIVYRNEGVNHISLDVIAFKGKKKQRRSYEVDFESDAASIPLHGASKVAIVVISMDKKKINKRTRGYNHLVLNIVSSISIAIAVMLPPLFSAYLLSNTLMGYYPGYVIRYVLPIVIGVVMGVVHFFLVQLISGKISFGGK